MSYTNLLYEIKNGLAYVTINRPDKLNALNDLTMHELKEIFTGFRQDQTVHAIIITGAGEKAFVAGADIGELNRLDAVQGCRFAEKGQEVFNIIENLGKPVIAAVNGYALGGGCELALACHIRLAAENAVFGQPEVNLGIIPGYGGTQRLARLINPGRAMEYILSGDNISAEEAYRLGLVNHVYPKDELMEKATELAKKILSKGQVAVSMAVRAVTAVNEMPEEEGQKLEAALFGLCCGTEDFMEGTSAFLDKRKPDFKNQ